MSNGWRGLLVLAAFVADGRAAAQGAIAFQASSLQAPVGIALARAREPVGEAIAARDRGAPPNFIAVADTHAIVVFKPDGTVHRTFDGLPTLGGLDSDSEGRLYVSDVDHGKVLRYLSDGRLDPSFGDDGALAGPRDKPFRRPTSVAVVEIDLPSSGRHRVTDVVVAVVDAADGRLVLCGRESYFADFECVTGGGRDGGTGPRVPANASIQGVVRGGGGFAHWDASEPLEHCPFIFNAGDRLSTFNAGISAMDRASPDLGHGSHDVKSLTARNDIGDGLVYVAGVDRTGQVVDWYLTPRSRSLFGVTAGPKHHLKLGFQALAVAVDANVGFPKGCALLGDCYSSPMTLYVAGSGHMEQRIVPPEKVW